MKAIIRIVFALVVAGGIFMCLSVPAVADTSKPPMVSSSKTKPLSPEMSKVGSAVHSDVKIIAIAVGTEEKKVGGKTYDVLRKPFGGGTTVMYSYRGREGELRGWDAVHFLIKEEYVKWKEVDGKRVGLVRTEKLDNFGPGITAAVHGGSDLSVASGFDCNVQLTHSALFGKTVDKNAYPECRRKVEAKRKQCIKEAAGDSNRIGICNDACRQVMVTKCNPLQVR